MKKTGIILLVLLLLTGAGIGLYAYLTTPKEEGIAHLRRISIKPLSGFDTYSSSMVLRQTSKPAEIIDLPAGLADSDSTLSYFALTVGKKVVYAVMKTNPSAEICMWIDKNSDLHFSDEKSLTGVSRKYRHRKYEWRYFDFGTILLNDPSGTASFNLICESNGHYFMLLPICRMEGKIRLGKQVYRVTVIDGDFDGDFKTLYVPSANYRYCGSDTFLADVPSGLFSRNRYDNGKCVPLGKYYLFSKDRYGSQMPSGRTEPCYYSIDLSADGKTLKMQPVEPAAGTLKIGSSRRLSATILSDAVTQSVDFDNEINLPAGRYQMLWGYLKFTDRDGAEYKMTADFSEDLRKGAFEIKAGEAFTLNPGPPFTIRTEVEKTDDVTLGINAELVGNKGETYGLRRSSEMAKPTLRILDENANEVHSGTMEYG
jgi:hypothetical protein